MDIVSGLIVYLLTWWLVLFMVLPWGLERDEQGRPQNPKLKKKIIITTLISAVFWLGIDQLIRAEIISFREMASNLS